MFVGFIVVVVILVVVVGLMSTGSTDASSNGAYVTEAKKVQALLSTVEAESQFYYVRNETFTNIGVEYLAEVDFASGQLQATSNMAKVDWIGWPVADGGFPDPYTGPYIAIGGTAGDDIRLIITSIGNGKNVGIYLVKRKISDIPIEYTTILERILTDNPSYIGG